MKHLDLITSYWDQLFPNPTSDLVYHNAFELLVAVMLSAQTTDKAVNKITPTLFCFYPTIETMKEAKIEHLESLMKSIGLYKTKAKNVKATAQLLFEQFHGAIPSTLEELTTLPGVGRKTASVVLIEAFNIPAFPVDTHVARVSKRLNLVKESDNTLQIELKLRKLFPSSAYKKRHHQMIHFGRYHCKAIKPNCENCQLTAICKYRKEAIK